MEDRSLLCNSQKLKIKCKLIKLSIIKFFERLLKVFKSAKSLKSLNNSQWKRQKPHYLNRLKLECAKLLLPSGTILHLQGIGQDDLRGVSIPYFFDSMNKHEPNQNRCTVYLSNNIQLTGAHKGIAYSHAAD